MKLLLGIVGLVVILFVSFNFLLKSSPNMPKSTLTNVSDEIVPSIANVITEEKTAVIAQNLDTPWGLAFLPDNDILLTERKGTVRLIENGELLKEPVAVINSVKEVGEGGLLGIVSHPDFSANNFVYLYYTYQANGNNTLNRVVRMDYKDKKLSNEKIIVDNIPGASNHNGGRIKFGPDKYLYITTGDAQEPSRSQDRNSVAGKILRVTPDGKPAPGNPFNTLIYSYGHRNSQGITWDNNGQLYATEHGRSGFPSGLDELNKIDAGKNYGWPDIQGNEGKGGMEKPLVHSGNHTWAPGGITFVGDIIYFVGLRGSALYRVDNIKTNIKVSELFTEEYGRLRDIVTGPDGMLYMTTSNLDGRGNPKDNDDKLVRVNPDLL